jgi:hypothetical protein
LIEHRFCVSEQSRTEVFRLVRLCSEVVRRLFGKFELKIEQKSNRKRTESEQDRIPSNGLSGVRSEIYGKKGMDVLEDKTYAQAWQERFDEVKQEFSEEVDKRLTKIVGATVASVVEDIPDDRRRERVRRVLLMGKVGFAFELARKRKPLFWLTVLGQDEVDELIDFIIELYSVGKR